MKFEATMGRKLLAASAVAVVLAAGAAWAFRWYGVQAARERGRTGAPAYTPEELEAMSRNLYRAQKKTIAACTERWDWAAHGTPVTTPTGLVYLIRTASADTTHAQPGDAVAWTGDIRLLDSTVCFAFSSDEPLIFRIDRADVPSGFHELARALASGDSAEALLPSYLGWGLSGHAPEVPPDAILWVRIRQQWADS